MRIGFDAKWFFDGPPSGRVVVRALVRELLNLPTPHEWFIFTDRDASAAFPYARDGVHVVPIWARNNLLSNVCAMPRAAVALNLDVILYQNFVAPWGSARRTGLVYDVIFASHPQYYTWRERLYFAPLRILAGRADRLCTISDSERHRMLRMHYGDASRLDVVPLGVDPAFRPIARHDTAQVAELRQRLSLPRRFILFVGRLNARKNVSGLVRALKLRSGPQIPCVIVGERDWMADDPRRLAEELGLSDSVHFLGALSFEDLVLIYAMADVFCFPSFEEGFGLPALESMASAVPVVASNVAALQEVCGEAAEYCDPGDAASIARALDVVIGDTGRAERMRHAGIARAQQFTWRAGAMHLLTMLEASTTA